MRTKRELTAWEAGLEDSGIMEDQDDPKITEEQMEKLEKCFFNDASIEEAASYAGVGYVTLTRYVANNAEWYGRMVELPHARYAQAKINLGEKIIMGDAEMSQWLLERKQPAQFSSRQKIDLGLPEVEGIRLLLGNPEPKKTIDLVEEPKGHFARSDGGQLHADGKAS